MDPDPVCPERLDPDPVCPERLYPDPVNIRTDPQPCSYVKKYILSIILDLEITLYFYLYGHNII